MLKTHRNRFLFLCSMVLAWVTSNVAFSAQVAPSRYELGQRLGRLERILEARGQVSDRAVVLPHMEAAVQAFFSMDPTRVAQHLDRAYVQLLAAGIDDSETITRLGVLSRFVVRGERFLQGERPDRLQFELSVLGGDAAQAARGDERLVKVALIDGFGKEWVSKDVPLVPGAFHVDAPEGWRPGDYRLLVAAKVGEIPVEVASTQVSWVPGFDRRIAGIENQLEQHPEWKGNLRATAALQMEMLRRAFSRQSAEMDLPVWRL
ncbi:MAG: hypothetical protein KDB61_11855, partial [Planctomycetes bacterium]|nr:hypothetical protein [Planctomycetota bacterium]